MNDDAKPTEHHDYLQRRNFIIEAVANRGRVSFKEVQDYFSDKGVPASDDRLNADEKEFFSKFPALQIERRGKAFQSTDSRHRSRLLDQRRGENPDGKKAIARYGHAILRGHPNLTASLALLEDLDTGLSATTQERKKRTAIGPNAFRELLGQLRQLVTQMEADYAARSLGDPSPNGADEQADELIVMQLQAILKQEFNAPSFRQLAQLLRESSERKRNYGRVRELLDNLWRKPHRHAILDAGTTTEAIADRVKDSSWDGPPHLRVFTNSPEIEKVLGAPEARTEVIGLMGGIRKDTSARTGHWSEVGLSAMRGVHVDVSIVGTTGIIYSPGGKPRFFACDSDLEAMTKGTLMDMGQLKVVVADSDKLKRQTTSAYGFAEVEGDRVDLLITDDGYKNNQMAQACVESIRSQGIVVVAGEVNAFASD